MQRNIILESLIKTATTKLDMATKTYVSDSQYAKLLLEKAYHDIRDAIVLHELCNESINNEEPVLHLNKH